MTDVLLQQTNNNGDIIVENGIVEMSAGLESAAYLSLFGGADWWGNIDETLTARQYDCKTQKTIDTLPPSSRNLLRIEEAVKSDLAWFISEKVASSVEVSAIMPALNMVQIAIVIKAEGQEADFVFIENWKNSI